VLPDGYRRDTVYYSILAGEWEQVKENLSPSLSEEGEVE
jgi:hypothetical protein